MSLEFKIELSGNFAGALEKNAVATDKAGDATKKHKHELELFESEIGKASAGIGGFSINLEALGKGGSLFTFDMAEGAKSVLEVFEKVVDVVKEGVELVVDLGKEMVKAAADSQDLDLAISLDLEGSGVSEDAIRELGESFEKTRFGGKQIKEMLLPLLEQGTTDPEQLDDLATAATDIAARRKSGAAGVQAALGAFQQIGLRREVNSRILRELAINEHDFYKDLGGLLHTSEASAKQQAEKGKLQAKTLLSVALNEIAHREGGAIGNATLASAKTVGGLIDRLERLPERYFEKLSDSPGLARFQGFLGHVLEVLDPDSPDGQRIQAAIERLFDRMMGLFDDTKGGAEGLADTIVELIQLVGDLVPMVVNLAKWIITSADKLADVVDDARMFVAIQSGDKKALNEIAAEVGTRKAGRAIERAADEKKQQDIAITDSAEKKQQDIAITNSAFSLMGVPKFAAGGFVDRPTLAIVGDNGPEWMLPERRLNQFAELAGGGAAPSQAASITYAPTYYVSGKDASELREVLEDHGRTTRVEIARLLGEMMSEAA